MLIKTNEGNAKACMMQKVKKQEMSFLYMTRLNDLIHNHTKYKQIFLSIWTFLVRIISTFENLFRGNNSKNDENKSYNSCMQHTSGTWFTFLPYIIKIFPII